jgi:hypothetical protein
MGNQPSSPPPDNRSEQEKILDAHKIPREMGPYFADRKIYATNMLEGMDIPQLPRLITNLDDLMNKYNHGGFKNTLAGVGKPARAMNQPEVNKSKKRKKKGQK